MKIVQPSYEFLPPPGMNAFPDGNEFIERGMSVRFVFDRGVSHEMVHRLCAFSQESTRYCNYSKKKHGNQITVIDPCFWEKGTPKYHIWKSACLQAENDYFRLVDNGAKPQEARSVLPNSLKTEIVVTANLREWMHILSMRAATNAHPQIRQVMVPLLAEVQERVPIIFDGICEPTAG